MTVGDRVLIFFCQCETYFFNYGIMTGDVVEDNHYTIYIRMNQRVEVRDNLLKVAKNMK